MSGLRVRCAVVEVHEPWLPAPPLNLMSLPPDHVGREETASSATSGSTSPLKAANACPT